MRAVRLLSRVPGSLANSPYRLPITIIAQTWLNVVWHGQLKQSAAYTAREALFGDLVTVLAAPARPTLIIAASSGPGFGRPVRGPGQGLLDFGFFGCYPWLRLSVAKYDGPKVARSLETLL